MIELMHNKADVTKQVVQFSVLTDHIGSAYFSPFNHIVILA